MITKKKAIHIANYIFRKGIQNTTQGNWCFSWDELEEHFEEMMNDTDTWFLEDGTIFSGEVA